MRFIVLLFTITFAAMCGCGSHDRVKLGKVRGTVSYQGKPIVRGSLIFEVAGARSACGRIVEGQITEVTTYASDDGAPVGLAHIAVFASQIDGPSKEAISLKKPANPQEALAGGLNYIDADNLLLPPKYTDPTTSGLAWNITDEENNVTLDF